MQIDSHTTMHVLNKASTSNQHNQLTSVAIKLIVYILLLGPNYMCKRLNYKYQYNKHSWRRLK